MEDFLNCFSMDCTVSSVKLTAPWPGTNTVTLRNLIVLETFPGEGATMVFIKKFFFFI